MRERRITLHWPTLLLALSFGVACSANDSDPSDGGPKGGTGSGDPLNAAPTCSSKSTWSKGESAEMRPGEACISCHTENGGPRISLAGTAYATGHEPNDCEGAAGATIVIVDAENREHRLTTNRAGNFHLEQAIPLPYRAHILTTKGERFMVSPQSSGDCNSCHTQNGANSAPGRITLP